VDEVLLRKAVLCRDRIAKIRRALPADSEELAKDEMLEAFISFNLFLLIQDVVDLATHIVAERGLGIPGSQREVFDTLAGSKLITRSTAEAMASMASLRNRIAHIYGSVDVVRLGREAPTGLDAVGRFLDEIAEALAAT
jgi:uncharacterized protein YutE (UPF0331/DUF86 family)